jgi:hypothetical protein
MRVRKKVIIDDITFDPTEPTMVSTDRLHTWVIWQFPRARAGGFSGAVHPPEPGHGWYPAIVNIEAGHVLVFGHVKDRFPTPELAAKSIDQAKS